MKVLVWGFYEEGNLGDDLMAVMVAGIVRSLGMEPVILSRNPRFRTMGYASADSLASLRPDAILLGGGAFFKATSRPEIEARIAQLAEAIEIFAVPVIGVSLGSDGIARLEDASPARQAVVASRHFRGTTVRLRRDLKLGIPNATFLPDIVFATACFRQSLPHRPLAAAERYFLINLSRRTAPHLIYAPALGRGHRKAFFQAHAGDRPTGGELTLPFFPRIQANDMIAAIDILGHCAGIMSSKLHPGIMALSMGNVFHSVAPRPKTLAFAEEYVDENIISINQQKGNISSIYSSIDTEYQRNIIKNYKDYISTI